MQEKILFLDRDGTLVHEPVKKLQIDNINEIILERNVIQALCELRDVGYKFVMITNQDGLGTLSYPLVNFNNVNDFILRIFESQNIKFEKILICPHILQDNCKCRKPNIKMVESWLKKDNFLDKKNSYVIGDRDTDIELAKNMGIKGIKYGCYTYNWDKIRYELTGRNRYAEVSRSTKETKVKVKVWIDKKKTNIINTGIGFFDHMLEQIAIHSKISMNVFSRGDLHVDDHHTIEDTAIVLGQAFSNALGCKLGIKRFDFILPMDESLASCVLDISGRPHLSFSANFNFQKVGDFSTEMVKHFFHSLVYSMKISLHLKCEGENDHHRIESLFKVFGKTLGKAIKIEGSLLPSSKGVL